MYVAKRTPVLTSDRLKFEMVAMALGGSSWLQVGNSHAQHQQGVASRESHGNGLVQAKLHAVCPSSNDALSGERWGRCLQMSIVSLE